MSIATNVPEAGGITTFNIEHGFAEAVVRGFRSGFLTDYDYHHLTQCETLDGAWPGLALRCGFGLQKTACLGGWAWVFLVTDSLTFCSITAAAAAQT